MVKNKNGSTIISEAEMEAKVLKQKEERARKCYMEIDAILKKYKCEMQPVVTVTAQGNKASININPI